MADRKTTAQFIQQAIAVHGDKYDYSEANYISAHIKVKIKCLEHGFFKQNPANHLIGKGCADCGGSKQKTTIRFIKDARKIHGDKYDYSEANYIRACIKVKIKCLEHGFFEQQANSHLRGSGCPACAQKNRSDLQRKNVKDFIEQSKKVHGDKYDYSEANYIGARIKVKIKCLEHGFFEQRPYEHSNGHGCPACAQKIQSDLQRKNVKDFIEDARKIHGDKYDYGQVVYQSSQIKVKIKCLEHGFFEQIPNSHLRGCGCPQCAESGFNKEKEGVLYFLKFKKDFATFWKIGITNRTVDSRFGGDALFITDRQEWHFDKGLYAYQIEQTILKEFAKFRYEMPLFSLLHLGGDTECFSPSLPSQKVIDTVERLRERIKPK
jgi:hypothetical protein